VDLVTTVCHQCEAKLAPPSWAANVYELTYTAAAQLQNCSGRVGLELGEQDDRWYTRELPNHCCYP
jgi:hypothetical protein